MVNHGNSFQEKQFQVAKILETNYARSARSDAFLRSIGAQALRGGLAKNLILIFIIGKTIIIIIRDQIRIN